jgi:alkylated DNA repair dioxygenase AlkB
MASKEPDVTAQIALFPDDASKPQGLRYRLEFVSPEEEEELITRFSRLSLAPFQFGAFEGRRRVAWFGWRYDYTSHSLEKADAFPAWIAPIVTRVESFADLAPTTIKQLLLTEYEVGAGIGWHRDKRHFDQVFGLSLGSAGRFRFRRRNGNMWQRFTLDAQPRSLYALTGEARSIWEHSIPPVEAVRYSITFRTMVQKE